MSRIAAVTRIPSALSSGLSMSLDRKFAAILAQRGEFDAGADLLRQRIFGGPESVGHQAFRETFRNDVFHHLSQKFVAAIPELFFGLHVQQHDLSGLIHHDHGVRRGFEQPAISALHLRQMLSAALRTLMSRIAAVTRIPSALSSGST
jgi:hypothetical protein